MFLRVPYFRGLRGPQRAAVVQGMSARFKRKSGEVVIIPAGSRSQPGTLMGVGPRLCVIPRILLQRTSVNKE